MWKMCGIVMRVIAGQRAALFLGPVPEDKLPKDATPGRILVGTLSMAKKENGNGEAPGKVSLSYRCFLRFLLTRFKMSSAVHTPIPCMCTGSSRIV